MELYKEFRKYPKPNYKLEDISSAELIADVNENCIDIDPQIDMKALQEYCEYNAQEITEFEFQRLEAMDGRR